MAFNPVERSLLDLCQHWEKFRSDTAKRLLVWQVQDNAVRTLQCFFEIQKHETELSTRDLFIVFDTPFENTIQYSRELKEALAGQYDASRDDLEQEGIRADWQFIPGDFADSAAGFLQGLHSFAAKYHPVAGHIAAVFMPQSVADDTAFCSWLTRALSVEMPEYLRLVVIDSSETPRLSPLTESGHPLITKDSPQIDALAIAQQTFAEEGGVGPAAVFRNFLMGLMTLVEKGSINQVRAKASDALAFARRQGWAEQEVVVTMLVAGAMLKEKRFDSAIQEYQNARQSAAQATSSGHPAGQQLVLQTWFGEAGTHLAAGKDAEAAECYDQAARVAQKIPDLILAIEAFRMSLFCHARLKQRDAALERGRLTLALGERLKPEARAMTTLPMAAIDLLRVIEPERVKRMEAIKQRQEEARIGAEQQAAEAEGRHASQLLRTIENQLENETTQAEHAAMQSIESEAGAGDERFRRQFAQAQDLLGEAWPLSHLMAAPVSDTAEASAA